MIGPDLRGRLEVPALRFGEQELDVADLVFCALADGTWARFVEESRRGVGLDREQLIEPPADAVHAAATAFRYRHRLLSAADFRAWLATRGLVSRDLGSVLRRELLRQAAVAHPSEPAGDEETAAVLGAEALCRGLLVDAARSAVQGFAALRGLAPGSLPAAPDPARVSDVAAAAGADAVGGLAVLPAGERERRAEMAVRLEEAMAGLAEQVSAPDALTECVEEHRLDWLRVAGRAVAFGREGPAREARMLVEDGVELSEVAALAGARPEPSDIAVASAPAEIAGALVSAVSGEVVGPWADNGGWRVIVVEAKLIPHVEDPATRERARAQLLADALDRLAAGQVERRVAL